MQELSRMCLTQRAAGRILCAGGEFIVTSRDDAGTHSHLCIFGGHIYDCIDIHAPASGTMRPGGRYCPLCKAENQAALDKLGVARRSMFQEGT